MLHIARVVHVVRRSRRVRRLLCDLIGDAWGEVFVSFIVTVTKPHTIAQESKERGWGKTYYQEQTLQQGGQAFSLLLI
jgi:hypothetical protein